MPFVDVVRLACPKETTRPHPFMAVLLTVTGPYCLNLTPILPERLALLRVSCGSKPTTRNDHRQVTVSYSPDKARSLARSIQHRLKGRSAETG